MSNNQPPPQFSQFYDFGRSRPIQSYQPQRASGVENTPTPIPSGGPLAEPAGYRAYEKHVVPKLSLQKWPSLIKTPDDLLRNVRWMLTNAIIQFIKDIRQARNAVDVEKGMPDQTAILMAAFEESRKQIKDKSVVTKFNTHDPKGGIDELAWKDALHRLNRKAGDSSKWHAEPDLEWNPWR